MRLALSLVAVLASTSVAVAESASPTDKAAVEAAASEDKVAVALGTNVPFFWPDAQSVGVSGYIGFANHHAMRFNYATHENGAFDVFGEALYSGRTTDVGVGYQYFTRGIFEGWTLEAGAFRRSIDHRVVDENAPNAIVETKTTGYAARGLVGYSWLWEKRLFLSTAVGMSVGRYTGTERTAETTYMPEYSTAPVARWQPAAEAYLRLGVAFGL